MHIKRTALVSVLCGALGATSACAAGTTTPAHHKAAATASPVTTTSPAPESLVHKAIRLRTTLEALLGQHAVLSVELTRSRLRNDPDLAQAAEAEMSKNTAAMTSIVQSVYGASAAGRFRSLWSFHQELLFKYSGGVATDDAAERNWVRTQLRGYVTQLGAFLDRASRGAISPRSLDPAVQGFLGLMAQEAETYARHDYGTAYAIERKAYAQMYALGTGLAAAVATSGGQKLPADFDSPRRRLESALGMLLIEDLALTTDAMRAGVADRPDFTAAAHALNGNTTDLIGAVQTLFGRASATDFGNLWGQHIDAFMRYTSGVAQHDEATKTAALKSLGDGAGRLSAFLATFTKGRATVQQWQQVFHDYDATLVREIDAYAKGDYSTAHDAEYEAYQRMMTTAHSLSAAFSEEAAARLPSGAVQTGGGGMAGRLPSQ